MQFKKRIWLFAGYDIRYGIITVNIYNCGDVFT